MFRDFVSSRCIVLFDTSLSEHTLQMLHPAGLSSGLAARVTLTGASAGGGGDFGVCYVGVDLLLVLFMYRSDCCWVAL
jgi:hypothetical protein